MTRSLPQIIGSTESALGALLDHALAPFPALGRDEWIYLNMSLAGAPLAAIAATLQRSVESVERIRITLRDNGILDAAGVLTSSGNDQLTAARESVTTATAQLTADIDASDIDATARTLELIQQRARAQATAG
ncbi:hypothetical protein [Gordonia sputi]|uniref:MarR family transcriptional regulator n=1 Tax=Gordonia sputi NBRC 100414 TaxID=1089453 RepID=H5TUN6_9ACTN|nr:hypothetical protein [Gordonia sputi]NKY95608.1 hypothetical protein [Gordonia sputi]GAB37194.1 hypothetical protein GOSPT_004_00090 [Gordonia sputi NBRC 100414]